MDPVATAWIQGLFYLSTGLWPIIHIRSFLAVTGPKVDLWLVRTVGLLLTCTGAVALYSATMQSIPIEVKLLCILNCLTTGGVDVYYVFRKRISRVYLLDAAAELVLIGLWVTG